MTQASSAPASEIEERLPTAVKVSWGAGALGAAILMNAVSGLIVYYLTKIVGMPSWVAGVLLSVARIYDALSDPFIGYLSDRTPDRFGGRRRPYLFAGAFMSALAILLAFNIPFEGGGVGTIIYVLIVLLFFGTAYSTFNVPYIAMPAEMTTGYHERSSIHAWRVVFASGGGAIAGAGAGLILQFLSGGKRQGGVQANTAEDYSILSAVFAVLILISMLTAWRGTRSAKMNVRNENQPPWREQLSSFTKNKPFLIIMAVKASQLIGFYASQTASFFMIVEILKLSSGDLAYIGLSSLSFSIVATPLLVMFSRKFGKRLGYIVSALFTATSYVSWIFAVPGEPSWILMIRGALVGVGFSGNVLFAMSMVSDAIELDSHRTGMRREGTYTAVYSFVEKMAGALGPTIVGVALSWAGFNAKTTITAENYDVMRNAALIGMAYAPAFFTLLSVVFLCFYGLSEKVLRQSRETALEQRQ